MVLRGGSIDSHWWQNIQFRVTDAKAALVSQATSQMWIWAFCHHFCSLGWAVPASYSIRHANMSGATPLQIGDEVMDYIQLYKYSPARTETTWNILEHYLVTEALFRNGDVCRQTCSLGVFAQFLQQFQPVNFDEG